MVPAHSHQIPQCRVGVRLNMLNTVSGAARHEAPSLHPPTPEAAVAGARILLVIQTCTCTWRDSGTDGAVGANEAWLR